MTSQKQDLGDLIDKGWQRFRQSVEKLQPAAFDKTTKANWTVKEMLAHVAFWEETVVPVVAWLRGDEESLSGSEWYGGDDLEVSDGEWPLADIHNAREARWAKGRSAEEVISRWDVAHKRVLAVVASLTDEDLQNPKIVEKITESTHGHYGEHLRELRAGFVIEGGTG